MANLTNYGENLALDYLLDQVTHLGLFTTNPGETGAGTEVSGGGYSRRPISFNPSVNGQSANSADVLFPTATASWGTITHVGLFDAITGGNMIWHGQLSASKAIGTDDEFKFASGRLIVSME